uniref:Uncharacterized protein n=1 Tax=Avena sativa TaxID=4498 RepID=A0ACD5VTP0_AVESA
MANKPSLLGWLWRQCPLPPSFLPFFLQPPIPSPMPPSSSSLDTSHHPAHPSANSSSSPDQDELQDVASSREPTGDCNCIDEEEEEEEDEVEEEEEEEYEMEEVDEVEEEEGIHDTADPPEEVTEVLGEVLENVPVGSPPSSSLSPFPQHLQAPIPSTAPPSPSSPLDLDISDLSGDPGVAIPSTPISIHSPKKSITPPARRSLHPVHAEPAHVGVQKVKLPGRRLCKLTNASSPDQDQLHGFSSWETDDPMGDSRDEDHSGEEVEIPDDTHPAEEEEEEQLPDIEIEATVGSSRKPAYKLQARIFNSLYAHQREGLCWLWSLHCRGTGGILGDDMGLGKTMQVSAFLAGLFHSALIRRVLVVAPKTVLTHWSKELTVVGLGHMIRDYSGLNKKNHDLELKHAFKEGGIVLTTYGIVRNNYKKIRGDVCIDANDEEIGKVWNYVILDEAHSIKNPKTQTAQRLYEIPCFHWIAISGTPIQNNLEEMWAIFNFCCPEVLDNKKNFRENYELPISRGIDKSASDGAKRIGLNVAMELRERIKPYFLRRMKNEVFLEIGLTDDKQLPKKNELTIWLKLTDRQRQLYKAFLNCEHVHLAASQGPLAAIRVLKKICNDPRILTKRYAEHILEGMDGMLNNQDMAMAEKNNQEIEMAEKMAMNLADMVHDDDAVEVGPEVSCKLSFILALLRNLLDEGHHVLIFSQTLKMLNLIQEAILLEGYNFLRMDGSTEPSKRERIVKDFQEGLGGQIFLLTTKVGGLGLTLTKASRVIVVDPDWNPSIDNQSVDRAFRIGQTKDVIVYRLITSGTVEEKIYKMQVLKGALFRAAMERNEQTRYFNLSDIQDPFSLPEQGFDVSLTQKQLQEEHGSPPDM